MVTHELDGKLGLLRLDERKPHVSSLAQKAAASFLQVTLHPQDAYVFAQLHKLLPLVAG